jgi:hypothetical protein
VSKVTRLVTGPEIDASVREVTVQIHAVCAAFFLKRRGANANPAVSVICALVAELTTIAVIGGMSLDELLDHVEAEFEDRAEKYRASGAKGLVE